MRYSTIGTIVFISAAIVALLGAYLAHTVLRMPPLAVRDDALGMAACLIALIGGVGLFVQWRSK
jgi:hypothetical protein